MAIKQKIVLDAEDFLKTLKELGTTGEAAAKQLQEAINRINTKKVEDDLASVKKSSEGVLASITNLRNVVTGSILFKATQELIQFATAGIQAAKAITQNADAVGFSAKTYQVLSQAMKDAGGTQDQLTAALRKFTQAVDQQGGEQLKTSLDITKTLLKNQGGLSSIVFKTVEDFQKLQKAAEAFAPIFRAQLEKAGDTNATLPLQALTAVILKEAQRTDEAGRVMRDALRGLGIEAPALGGTFEKLDNVLKKASGTLASLGITLIDNNGEVKSGEAAFLEFIDVVSKMPSSVEQANAIIKIFGRTAGKELVELIRAGKTSLEELSGFMERNRIGFSPEQLAAAEEADNALDKLAASYDNLKNKIGLALASPVSISFIDELSRQIDIFTKSLGTSFQGIKSRIDAIKAFLRDPFTEPPAATDFFAAISASVDALKANFQTQFAEIGATISAAWESIKSLATSAWESIAATATAAWERIKAIFTTPIDFSAVLSGFQSTFEQLVSIAQSVWDRIKSIFSSPIVANVGVSGNTGAGPFASGGYVRGPGTTTSDSILAWLSDQEFVINAKAVSHYGVDFFAALNSMRLPKNLLSGFNMGGLVNAMAASMPMPRFAGGGMVAAGAGGRPVTLVIDGNRFGMSATEDTVKKLQQFSVKSQMASTGRKPSWVR